MYRTFNHGQTWQKIFGYHLINGLDYWSWINKSVLDYSYPNDILYIATSNGIYKSNDLSSYLPSFTRLSDPLVDGLIFDLEMKQNDHNTLIACVRNNSNTGPWHWKIVQSTNGGTSWSIIVSIRPTTYHS